MTTDTIAAIATAPGAGGIGIVRVSGPGALPILEKLFAPARKGDYKPWTLRRGRVQDTEGNTLDDSLAVFMPGPPRPLPGKMWRNSNATAPRPAGGGA